MNRHRNFTSFAIATGLLGLLTLVAPMTTPAATWDTAANGHWDVAGNWTGGTLPSAGNPVNLTNTDGSYAVTYRADDGIDPLGALTISNADGQTTTLNVNAAGFAFAGGSMANATININTGGEARSTAQFSGGANATVVVNGGDFTSTGNFASPTSLDMTLSSGSITTTAGFFFPRLTMTGGTLSVSGTAWPRLTSGTISGGVFTNTSSASLSSLLGTIIISNEATVTTAGLVNPGQNHNTFTVEGGTIEITNDAFRIGDQAFSGARSGYITQTGGMVSMADAAGLVIGYADGGITDASINRYQLSGGTLNLQKITLNDTGAKGGRKIFEMSGGTLNLGAGGIVDGGGGAYSVEVLLSGGTIGAQADWSSSLNMSLVSGTTTFRTAHTDTTAHNITLSGNLSGNGGLTKTGAGTLLLNGVNGFTGELLVSEGTLGGTGSVTGNVSVSGGAALAPGASIGSLTIDGNLTMDSGSTLFWEFSDTENHDRIISGTESRLYLPESGTIVLDINGLEGFTLNQMDSFTLFDGEVWVAGGSEALAEGIDITSYFTINDNTGWYADWRITTGSLVLTAILPPPKATVMSIR